MPQLQSGRHVGVLPTDLSDGLRCGSEEQIYAWIIAFRLAVKTARDLVGQLPVIYFEEQEGETPPLKPYRSSLKVNDVLGGRADWTAQEMEEFRGWLGANATLHERSEHMFEKINTLIREHMIWDSELMTGISPAKDARTDH